MRPVRQRDGLHTIQQIGINCIRIFACGQRHVGVRERWVEQTAVARTPFVHGAEKRAAAPRADATFGVRREIAGVDRAKRRLNSAASSVGLATASGVTARAIANASEVFTTRNLCAGRDERRPANVRCRSAVNVVQQ